MGKTIITCFFNFFVTNDGFDCGVRVVDEKLVYSFKRYLALGWILSVGIKSHRPSISSIFPYAILVIGCFISPLNTQLLYFLITEYVLIAFCILDVDYLVLIQSVKVLIVFSFNHAAHLGTRLLARIYLVVSQFGLLTELNFLISVF